LHDAVRERTALEEAAGEQAFGEQHAAAINLLTSGKVTQAFDMDREPAEVRDRYGRHLFGQSLLLARRLAQVGVPIIQANMGIVQTWDTHDNNFVKLKERLLPPLDRGVSALLDDLENLGLLDETLVVMAGEFGRTPKISLTAGAKIPGRDHWPQVYTAFFAGAGVQGGSGDRPVGQHRRLSNHAVVYTGRHRNDDFFVARSPRGERIPRQAGAAVATVHRAGDRGAVFGSVARDDLCRVCRAFSRRHTGTAGDGRSPMRGRRSTPVRQRRKGSTHPVIYARGANIITAIPARQSDTPR